ncbi:MAG: hypothetical protein ABIB46_06290 [bacterium]
MKEKTKYHGFSKYLIFNGKRYELFDKSFGHSNVFNKKSTAIAYAQSSRNCGFKARVIKRIWKSKETGIKYQKYLVYEYYFL